MIYSLLCMPSEVGAVTLYGQRQPSADRYFGVRRMPAYGTIGMP